MSIWRQGIVPRVRRLLGVLLLCAVGWCGGARGETSSDSLTPLDIYAQQIAYLTSGREGGQPITPPEVSERWLSKLSGWGQAGVEAAKAAVINTANSVTKWGSEVWGKGKALAIEVKERATRAMLEAGEKLQQGWDYAGGDVLLPAFIAYVHAVSPEHIVRDVVGGTVMLADISFMLGYFFGEMATGTPAGAAAWNAIVDQGKALRGPSTPVTRQPDACASQQYASMANAAYADSGEPPEGWEVFNDPDLPMMEGISGFSATLYKQPGALGEAPKYCLSFRGTEPKLYDPRDMITDIGNPFGVSGQYLEAANVAAAVQKKYGGNVVLTGHSLGGGLAQYASLATGLNAFTFNAAAPGHIIAGDSLVTGRIVNYRHDNDPLSALNEVTTLAGLTIKVGEDIFIPGTETGGDAHGIEPLRAVLGEKCSSSKKDDTVTPGSGIPPTLVPLLPPSVPISAPTQPPLVTLPPSLDTGSPSWGGDNGSGSSGGAGGGGTGKEYERLDQYKRWSQ